MILLLAIAIAIAIILLFFRAVGIAGQQSDADSEETLADSPLPTWKRWSTGKTPRPTAPLVGAFHYLSISLAPKYIFGYTHLE